MERCSPKVYIAPSQVLVNTPDYDPLESIAIFAKESIMRGEEICSYSGKLVHIKKAKGMDQKYWKQMSAPYRAAFPCFLLFGDDEEGDIGHYATGVPNNSNSYLEFENTLKNKDHFLSSKRIRTFLIAQRNIAKDEEIVQLNSKCYEQRRKSFIDNQSNET
jgi:hypothetical protein